MLNFIEGFFCTYSDDQVVFVFASVNMLYDVELYMDIELYMYVEPSLHTWDEADLVMVYLFDMLLNWVLH
jgi:hypothetical protein